ncbi:MAG: sigma-70 family RNA polymerase sigma factor [Anaerolineae bacterium]
MSARTNNEWLSDLQSVGPRQDRALIDLRNHLARATEFYLQRREGQLRGLDQTEQRQLVEDVAQDALVRVLDHLDSFRGESRFTTWAAKFAVHAAAAELRRARWRNVSLDAAPEDNDEGELGLFLTEPGVVAPERLAAQDQAWDAVQSALDMGLTERQREALVAVIVDGRPVPEVARKLKTTQNALYKLVFDARARLRRSLQGYGWSVTDVLDTFDSACPTC